METVYLGCAGVGGAVILCQFVVGALGLGGHHDLDGGHDAGHDGHHGGSDTNTGAWIIGLLTVKTISAGLTFFGLAGLAMLSNGAEQPVAFVVALVAGFAAVVLVAQMMRGLYRLKSDHTVKIDRAVGQTGQVYLTVPGARSGTGKVTISVQGRSVEYQAVTAAGELLTGARVVVVAVAGPGTLEVVPVSPEVAHA